STCCLIGVAVTLLKFQDVPGPTGPGVGTALLFGIIVLIISATVIVACCFIRPPREALTLTNILLSLLVIVTSVGLFWAITQKTKNTTQDTSRYILELQLLDRAGKPIASAPVSYGSLTDGDGRKFFS